MTAFDAEKLLENAIASIRLGVEDFLLSQKKSSAGGDAGRTLSAVRNLYSGTLLLFKYRIATKVENGELLIFDIEPVVDGKGFRFVPRKSRRTLDFDGIRSRFKTFGITTDWTALDTIQKERNAIEHLHSEQTAGAVGKFLADLFPVLRDFITNELDEIPANLLGDTWQSMLAHHDFFDSNLKSCQAAWKKAGIPPEMKGPLLLCTCEECGSPLIHPDEDKNGSSTEIDEDHYYVCLACAHQGKSLPLLEESLSEVLGGFNPFNGEDPPTANCPNCGRETFSIEHQECFWCGQKQVEMECAVCGNGLSLDEARFGGLCDYHRHIMERERNR